MNSSPVCHDFFLSENRARNVLEIIEHLPIYGYMYSSIPWKILIFFKVIERERNPSTAGM